MVIEAYYIHLYRWRDLGQFTCGGGFMRKNIVSRVFFTTAEFLFISIIFAVVVDTVRHFADTMRTTQ